MWSRRVAPVLEVGVEAESTAAVTAHSTSNSLTNDSSSNADGNGDADADSAEPVVNGEKKQKKKGGNEYYYDPERDPTTSPFRQLVAGKSTVALWGKRVHQVRLVYIFSFLLYMCFTEAFGWIETATFFCIEYAMSSTFELERH